MTVQLHLGDCRKYVPPKFDVIITDPVWPNCPPGLLIGADNPGELLHQFLIGFVPRRLIIVMRYDSDPRMLQYVPSSWKFFRLQILRYAIPGYNGRKLGGFEFAYCFGDPVKSAPGRRVIPGEGPVVTRATPANGHPSPRAIEHFRWLVNWHTDPGEIVYDPFMGSGTTGVACVQMGRDFIGTEIDPGYFDIARKRIELAQMQPRLEGI